MDFLEMLNTVKYYTWALCATVCICLSVFIWIHDYFNCPRRALVQSTGFLYHINLGYT